MSYRNGGPPEGRPERDEARQASDALRQALSSLGSGAAGGALTPESLVELARRAGVANPGRLAEMSRVIGLEGSQAVAAVPQHIFYLLGEHEFALPASAVQSVERITDIARVPNTAAWILGVVQVWGAIVSVVDFRRFVGMPPQPVTSRSRLLVVSLRDMTVGFVVDAVTELRPLGDLRIGPLDERSAPGWVRPYAQGSIALDGHLVTLLDPERLLFSEPLHHYRADGRR